MNGGVFMKFKLKDPGSAITHGIALLLAAVGAVPLIIKAARSYDVLSLPWFCSMQPVPFIIL